MLKNRCLLLEFLKPYQTQLRQQLELAGIGDSKTIDQITIELIAAKSAANKTKRYLKSLSYYLRQFAEGRGNTPLNHFTVTDIENWMLQFDSPWTRKTWLSRLGTLFAFAHRRGYISNNPCTRVERVSVDKRPPKILTPEQAEMLVRITPEHCKAYLILALYAGIRPEEIERMDWKQINLTTKTVTVDGKTRRRRIVQLEPKAALLLESCAYKQGRVTPHRSTLVRHKKKWRMALNLSRFPQDLLRHTFASYALALHKNAGIVSTSMGNSNAVLLSHYHEPCSQASQERFWDISGHTKYDQGALATAKSVVADLSGGKTYCENQPEGDPGIETTGSLCLETRGAINE